MIYANLCFISIKQCILNFNRQKKKGEYNGERDIFGTYYNADGL